MGRPQLEIVTEKRRITVGNILSLFAYAGWTKNRTARRVKRMLTHTDVVVLAKYRGEPVGCARLITDGSFRGFIEDVIVLPHHRRNGIGKRMVRILERCAKKMGIPRLDLITREEGFWKQLGYARKVGSRYLMKDIETRAALR